MTSLANPFMHFSALADYRQMGKVTHKLSDIIQGKRIKPLGFKGL